MKFFYLLVIVLFFVSCNESKNDEKLKNEQSDIEQQDSSDTELIADNTTPKKEEFEPGPSFFVELSDDFFNEDYCFERDAAIKVINGGTVEDWTLGEMNVDFVSVTNKLCYSTFDFYVFWRNEAYWAFFSQMDKNQSEFKLLMQENNQWFDVSDRLPDVDKSLFFEELTDEEMELVEQYGPYYLYVNERGEVDILFGDWEMGENMGFDNTFKKESKYNLTMKWDEEEFWIERKLEE